MDQQAKSITASDLKFMLVDVVAQPKALPFALLEDITKQFSPELIIGEGGFAVVYKGLLDNSNVVAVKKLTEQSMDDKEFVREVNSLMRVNHENIVRFLGYCGDTQADFISRKKEVINSNKEQRLLCFEYVPNGSLRQYIKDPTEGLGWSVRYKIIKGICEGLYYIHEKINMVHLDLKPDNILMDKKMVPKITDFGLARKLKDYTSHVTATKIVGSWGYIAPEYIRGSKINRKFDLYSLGVIIIEILTGVQEDKDIMNVLESWTKRLEISGQWEQIHVCAKIGMQCIQHDQAQRPDSMKHIIEMLAATEISAQLMPAASGHSALLGVHPVALFFPVESNKTSACSLHMTNNTESLVAFRLRDKTSESTHCFVRVPLYGLVWPRSSYTLVVTTKDKNQPQEQRVIDLVLDSTRLFYGQESIRSFHTQPEEKFEEGKKWNNEYQEVEVKAVYNPRRGIITSSKQISAEIKILSKDTAYKSPYTLDTNEAKQWIVIGEHYGHIRIWNYGTQRKVHSLKISRERVTCVKFIARKQCLVAATADGYLHVYNYETQLQKMTSLRAADDQRLMSLAVHPTLPYLLLAYEREMKLLDWDKDWECIQTFKDGPRDPIIHQAAFIVDSKIACVSEDHTVKVWSLDSPKSRSTMSTHLERVNSMDFFTFENQEYLVTGSDDKTVKIWNMRTRRCVGELNMLMSPVKSVLYQPNLQNIIIGLEDGSVGLWSSISTTRKWNSPSYPQIRRSFLRPEKTINTGACGALQGIAYVTGRVVVGQEHTVAIVNISDDVNDHGQSTDYSEPYVDAHTGTRDTTSQELLDVHLRLPSAPMDPILRFDLGLTNKTDEDVAFRLIDKNPSANWGFEKALVYGIMPPRLACTFVVNLPPQRTTGFDELVVQSSTLGDKSMLPFEDKSELDDFFGEALEMGNVVHELTLRAVSQPSIPPAMPIKTMVMNDRGFGMLYSIDAHPTNPWMVTGHSDGSICLWNYDSQEVMSTVKESGQEVQTVKFVARNEWILAWRSDYFIQVYSCASGTQMEKIKTFRMDSSTSRVVVHPIHSYVLTTDLHVYDGNKEWDCIRRFQDGNKMICQVAFHPENANSFASASYDGIVQVWSLESPESNYTLPGHSMRVSCLVFFTREDGQFLLITSYDCTAKIWDLQKGQCIHKMKKFKSPVTTAIYLTDRPYQICDLQESKPCQLAFSPDALSLPDNRYLITGSSQGTVHVWSATDFRLIRVIDFGDRGPIMQLASSNFMDSRRVLIGQQYTTSIIFIDVEEAGASSFKVLRTLSDLYPCISWLPGVLCSFCNTWSQ